MTLIPYATPEFPHLPFGDQSGGMKAMGIVLIVIGAFAGCLAAFTPVALLVPRPPGVAAPMARDLIAGAAVYALFAGMLITAGVGSLRTKRWSRPAILIISGTWVLGGLLGLISWLIVGPDLQRAMATMGSAPGGPGPAGTPPGVPAGMAGTIGAVTVIMLVVFGVLLPGGYFWFYVRRSVRQTVEHYDPAPAWTDRCPTPVLALSAWLALAALFTLNFCLWGVFPLFGRLLSGPPAVALLAGVAGVLGVLAVGAYRLNVLAWWGTALLIVLLALSSVTTFSRVDPLEIHRLSGTPPETIAVMEQMNLTSRRATNFTTVLYALAGVVYLLWVWKYFRRAGMSVLHASDETVANP